MSSHTRCASNDGQFVGAIQVGGNVGVIDLVSQTLFVLTVVGTVVTAVLGSLFSVLILQRVTYPLGPHHPDDGAHPDD